MSKKFEIRRQNVQLQFPSSYSFELRQSFLNGKSPKFPRTHFFQIGTFAEDILKAKYCLINLQSFPPFMVLTILTIMES